MPCNISHLYFLNKLRDKPADNDDCLVLNLAANFVSYSIPDVDRWTAIVAPGSTRCQTLSDSLTEVAQKVAFRWLEVREAVEEDFAEETRIPVAAAARYFGFASESRTLHRRRRIPLGI